MGTQARAKRKRRELRQEHRAAMAKLNDKAGAPEVQAWLASHHDAGCAALKERDRPGQVRRLEAEGWVLRQQNLDGLGMWDHRRWGLRILHSVARELDGHAWAHVSVSAREGTMPTWLETRNAGWVMYPDRAGVIVVAPVSSHVGLAEVAHVWYKLTGAPAVPDFSNGIGSI
jgi:hypothetical protein